jgi:hypothetical protein
MIHTHVTIQCDAAKFTEARPGTPSFEVPCEQTLTIATANERDAVETARIAGYTVSRYAGGWYVRCRKHSGGLGRRLTP